MAAAGAEIGVAQAEAFRQYRGHPYPQDNCCFNWWGRQAVRRVIDDLGDGASQVAAVDDPVDEAVLAEEFARLKAAGQLNPDGLLDHAGAGEPDQGLGLGQDEVAQRGEAGRDAAHGGVSEDADV